VAGESPGGAACLPENGLAPEPVKGFRSEGVPFLEAVPEAPCEQPGGTNACHCRPDAGGSGQATDGAAADVAAAGAVDDVPGAAGQPAAAESPPAAAGVASERGGKVAAKSSRHGRAAARAAAACGPLAATTVAWPPPGMGPTLEAKEAAWSCWPCEGGGDEPAAVVVVVVVAVIVVTAVPLATGRAPLKKGFGLGPASCRAVACCCMGVTVGVLICQGTA